MYSQLDGAQSAFRDLVVRCHEMVALNKLEVPLPILFEESHRSGRPRPLSGSCVKRQRSKTTREAAELTFRWDFWLLGCPW